MGRSWSGRNDQRTLLFRALVRKLDEFDHLRRLCPLHRLLLALPDRLRQIDEKRRVVALLCRRPSARAMSACQPRQLDEHKKKTHVFLTTFPPSVRFSTAPQSASGSLPYSLDEMISLTLGMTLSWSSWTSTPPLVKVPERPRTTYRTCCARTERICPRRMHVKDAG